MPLSLLSSVELGDVTEAWSPPSPPAAGCRVEQGDVLLARLEEGEILWGERRTVGLQQT